MGIYLSAHPLDEYKIILDNLCNTRCAEMADVQQLKDREDVVIGGIVTAVNSRLDKKGKPFGIVTIEDFEGSGELRLFSEDWGHWSGMLPEGASVYITAKVQPRWQYGDALELKVQNIEFLQTVKERAVDRITISLVTDMLDDQIVAELSELISESPGKTKLFFQLRDSQGKHHVLLRSQGHEVDVRHTLIDFIDSHESMDYKIN